jgi:undecaprenyl-diphosphatase
MMCAPIIAVTIVGRLISGVHWITDIIGGILISTSLLFLFSWVRVRKI